MPGPRKSSTRPVAASLSRDKALPLRLLLAQEEERRRIARLLHDDLGQTLTAAVLELEYARTAVDAAQVIDGVLVEIRRLLGAARDLSLHLRPALIDEEGLEAALGALVSRLCSVTGCQARLQTTGLERTLPAVVALSVFRIVQDAALALAQGGAGHKIGIQLHATVAELTILISADAATEVVGFGDGLSLADRAALVEGSFEQHVALGGGLQIKVRIPLQMP